MWWDLYLWCLRFIHGTLIYMLGKIAYCNNDFQRMMPLVCISSLNSLPWDISDVTQTEAWKVLIHLRHSPCCYSLGNLLLPSGEVWAGLSEDEGTWREALLTQPRKISEPSQHHSEQGWTESSPNCWPKSTWYTGSPSYLTFLRPILSFLNGAHFSNLGLLWNLNEIILSEVLA